MIPQMFCVPGMTTYRALFDDLGIPYLGNPADVMAVGADKVKARSAGRSGRRRGARSAGAGPRRATDTAASGRRQTGRRRQLGRGVAGARPGRIRRRCRAGAARTAARVLVEAYVELGREVRCGIIVRDGELVCLPLEEYAMDPRRKPIRTSEDKLAADRRRRPVPGRQRPRQSLDRRRRRPAHRAGVGGGATLSPALWAAGTTACSTFASTRTATLVPGGRPLLLVLARQRHRRDGVRHRASPCAELFEIGLAEMKREGTPCLTSPR